MRTHLPTNLKNRQVEVVKKVLKTMVQWILGTHKWNWHLKLFLALWAYQTSIKNATGFTPFQLVYGLDEVLPIECEIPSLQLTIELFPNTFDEEEWFLYFAKLDENHHDVAISNEAHKRWIKVQYGKSIHPCVFSEHDLVLVYDQETDKFGAGKLEAMWHGLYVVRCILQNGTYELVDYDVLPLQDPWKGLYLKKYYA